MLAADVTDFSKLQKLKVPINRQQISQILVDFVDFDFSRKIMFAIDARSKSTHEN